NTSPIWADCRPAKILSLFPLPATLVRWSSKYRNVNQLERGRYMAKLKGKVAVVTGASKGIGAAIAEKLGSEGAKVVVNYGRDQAGAQKVTEKIKHSGGDAISVQADVSKA